MAQEALDDCQPLRVVERCAPMGRARDDDELNRGACPLISRAELVRLVDWHVRILVSMQQQQRRIVAIDVEHRTRQASQIRKILRLPAEQ